jgi:hypothetical protein
MVLPDGAGKGVEPMWFEEGENIRVADAFVWISCSTQTGNSIDEIEERTNPPQLQPGGCNRSLI